MSETKSKSPHKDLSAKSIEELKRKKNEIKDIVHSFPSILQITAISFKDNESTEAKPVVRCTEDIDIKHLIRTVFRKQWKLRSPRIVVIIMSNMESVSHWSDDKQIKSFQKGLMRAAENTNMWLITNGVDVGATTIVGNAVSDYVSDFKYRGVKHKKKPLSDINFIGVADEDNIQYMATIEASDEMKVEIATDAITYTDNKYRLNKDLSHYILIKDKTDDKNGVNIFIDGMSKFLSLIEEAPDGKDNELISIENTETPVVSLIINGGYGCARLVLKQIENRVPVIAFKGTGGLADLLAFVDTEICDRNLNEWDKDFAEIHLKPELTTRIINLFPKYRTDDSLKDELSDFRHIILESIRKSHTPEGHIYLTVVNLWDKYSTNLDNLAEILLSSLFKTRKSVESTPEGRKKIKTETIRKDMALCVDWNCPVVAKREVLTKDPTYSLNDEKQLFEDSLTLKNHCDFVDLFLSQKFRLRSFVTPKRIKRIFRKIHSNEFFSTVCWEGILGRSHDIRQSGKFIDRELNWLVEACTGNSKFFDESELSLFVTGQYPYSEREAERKSLEIIVLWAVLHFRRRLVRTLWRHSDRPINLALIIAMSYERLSWYVSEQSLNDQLKSESKQFVKFSLSVLDKCYKESAIRCDNVLSEAPMDWNYNTPIDLAAFGRFRDFFSHPSCQRWLTNKFYGNIAVKDYRQNCLRLPTFAKILLSAYLVFPIYWWIRITNRPKLDDEEEFDDEDDEENQMRRKSQQMSSTGLKTNGKNENYGNSSSDLSYTPSSSTDNTPLRKTNERQDKKPVLMKSCEIIKELVIDKESHIRYNPSVWTLIYEVWTAPITKFWNFQFFYTFYLSIFSIALLSPGCGNAYLDSWIVVWTILLILDDCRQTYILSSTNSNVSIPFHLAEIVFKCLFVVIFTTSRLWTTRFLGNYQRKVLMSVALLHAFIILLSKFLPISATLGPLLYRLKIMLLVDFLNFIRLSFLVMVSFGVIIQAMLYPDLLVDSDLVRMTFNRAFFTLFRVPVEDLLVDKKCDGLTKADHPDIAQSPEGECIASEYIDKECRNIGIWPYVFLIIYFVLLKLILLTLLFALFASSASKLTADTDAVWKFQRYGLVMDFDSRSPVPPPMNIFYYCYIAYKWIYNFKNQGYKTPYFKFKEFTLFILSAKSKPLNIHLADDEYNYFKRLASETFDEFRSQKSAETLASLQWERIQALSEESEVQRQLLRQMTGKVSEIDRKVNTIKTSLRIKSSELLI